VSAVHTGHLLP